MANPRTDREYNELLANLENGAKNESYLEAHRKWCASQAKILRKHLKKIGVKVEAV